MAEVQIRDILVGYGDLYYADYEDVGGVDDPTDGLWDPEDDLLVTGEDLRHALDLEAGTWTYAGATQEGVELAYAPEYGEVEVDQLGDAAVMFFQTASVTLNTQLAEATLENLIFAWGFQDSFLTGEKFSIGIPDQTPTERSIAVVGKGASVSGDAAERLYVGWRALSVEGSSLAMRRSENTSYQVSIRLLADPKHTGEEYGLILDRVVPAPSGP